LGVLSNERSERIAQMRECTVVRTCRSKGLRSTRGGTLAEFAVAIPLVMLMISGIWDFGYLFYSRLTIQHAVHEATRFAVTGRTLDDPDTGDPLTRVESIREVIEEQAANLTLDLDRLEIEPPDGGGPSQVVTVRAGFSYHFLTPLISHFFPGDTYDFTVQTSMKNEPFFENQN